MTVSFRSVCRHVEVDQRNNKTFSQELRQLLMLACTEVEAGCKAVLRANGFSKKGHWNMWDYRKLARPMRLSEYTVQFAMYPSYPPIRPFGAWRSGARNLPWYTAYNAVKHDREEALSKATFGNVVSALAGALVITVAQFGPDAVGFSSRFGSLPLYSDDPEFRLFEFGSLPTWKARELYVPPHNGQEWKPLAHVF
ncbi:MAG: hypothetical protein ABUL62_31820 [Myxococcales bacterium]